MNLKSRLTAVLLGGTLLVGAAAGIVAATGSDDNVKPVTGEALKKASAVAVAEAGGGKVTETELGDEDGYYEIEVTLPGGKQVDVHLDENFKMLSTHEDTETEQNGSDND